MKRALLATAAVLTLDLAGPAFVCAHAPVEELERAADASVIERPDDPQARLEHARVLQLAHRWDAALIELGAAAARGGDPDEIGATRGTVLLAAGRPLAALDEIDRVLARRADAPGLRFERGRTLLALGRSDEGAEELGHAIATMPEPRPEHVFARRDALLSAGRREAAVLALDEGMARIGRVASLQLAAIDIEVELGQHDRALHRVDELLTAAPRNPAWIARRGEILERAGRHSEARAEYERALALIEAHAASHRTKAFTALERRLQTALASSPSRDNGR